MPLAPNLYYRLSDLLEASAIPGNFKALENLAQTVIDALFSKIYYKDFVFRTYGNGEQRFYSIVLLSKRLKIPIFDIGLNLVFFDGTTTNFSEFPITMNWNWPVYRYIAGFGQGGFSYTPEAFIGLLMELIDIESEEEMIAEIINVFLGGGNDDYQTFFTNLRNRVNSYDSGLPAAASTEVQNIATQLQTIETEVTSTLTSTNLYSIQGLFSNYQNHTSINTAVNSIKASLTDLEENHDLEFNIVLDLIGSILDNFSTIDEQLENLGALFYSWLGNIEPEDIYELLIPQFELELTGINVALEFPRNWLVPMIEDVATPGTYIENPDPMAQAGIRFTAGDMAISSKYGFEFKNDPSFNFERCQIGQTGLILEVTNLQVDLSQHENSLPGTDAYGSDFKGVYIDELVIGLPSFWNKNSSATVDIFGDNVLIGSYRDGSADRFIFSGTVGLRDPLGPATTGALATTLPGGLGLELDTFSLTFVENVITQSEVIGELTIPLNSGNKKIQLAGNFNDNGFSLNFSGGLTPPLFTIPLGSFGEIQFMDITIGSEDGKFFFSFSARMPYESGFPIIDKLLPNPIELQEFKVSERGIEKFDINLRWNNLDEVAMDSAFGQDAFSIPVNLNILDVITIATLKIVLGQTNTGAISIKTLIDGKLEIGPLLATVGDIGIQSIVDYDNAGGGNLGPLNVDLKFVPPTKIGLKVDAEAVTGGGAIWFDFDNERYVGALELSIKETLELVVIGIMSFKKPDGTKGFSLLLLVTVEFAPVQLGMGFVLTGVGGLLGVNRGMNADVLRDGVRTGLLDYILFPTDPVANIAAIVQGLESAFPQRQDQFIIGPMVKLGWGGAKALVKLEIGLLIELFHPVKIAIPGVLSIELPTEDQDIIRLRVSFIGIVDFQDKFASFDASLFDSAILDTITISGDMAFRLKWGDEPDFLMSMGGFHPEYTPPPLKLPKMERIGISLLNVENAQVGFELYFAVSTNSVQTGAAVFAEFRAGKAVVFEASFSFDVLFEFDPFRMILSAQLNGTFMLFSVPIVSIRAMIRLAGPTPWNISGAASIAIIGIEFSVDFDHTFGEEIDTSVPNIALLPKVLEELEKPSNWRSAFPNGGKSMVQFRAVEDSERVTAHPSGRFTVEQQVTPLNIQLDKYGQNGIADAKRYEITKIALVNPGMPAEILDTNPLYNLFTPDQHFTLTEEEKLTRPSFERYISGVVIDKTDRLFVSSAQVKNVAYEQLLIQPALQDPNTTQQDQSTVTTNKNSFEALAKGGAVGESSLSKKNSPTQENITWQKATAHYIVNNITMQPFISSAYLPTVKTLSLVEAQHLLQQIIDNEPQLEDLLIILEQHELGASLVTTPADKAAVLAL